MNRKIIASLLALLTVMPLAFCGCAGDSGTASVSDEELLEQFDAME